MSIRAAVSSTDGKVINQHFGKTEFFLIFELRGGEFQYVEKRSVKPCCNMGEHEENAFEKTAKALNDCQIILVSKIGGGAADYMESRGFAVYESPFPINAVLNKLITDGLVNERS
jgi:predicted Fe-Mo cluster-binding NifX family protein